MRHTVGRAAPRLAAIAFGLVSVAVLGGCASSGAVTDEREGGTLHVSAAASLRPVFTQLVERFERERAGVEVLLTTAGSSDLATQILEGAPADVFAAADEVTMERVAEAGLLADAPALFAANTLVIAVPLGNPANIRGLADLARTDVRSVVCAPQVPCGAATRRAAMAEGVQLNPVSEEPSVLDVLGKVRSGEADAGLVYRTDVLGSEPSVEGVVLSPEATAASVNLYPIAVVAEGNSAAAQAFVALVLSEQGRQLLAEAGFDAP